MCTAARRERNTFVSRDIAACDEDGSVHPVRAVRLRSPLCGGQGSNKTKRSERETCSLQLRTKNETGESCGKGQKRDEIECAGALDLKNDVERYLWQ